MKKRTDTNLVTLNTDHPIWEHVYTVAPLVVIGTKEGDNYNLAPKHQAMPIGHGNYFGFVCTPAHGTWQNIKRNKEFTVSFPSPDQVILASLAASPRLGVEGDEKPIIEDLPTFRAPGIDALFLSNSYLLLECKLDRIVEGFDAFGLIAGSIVGAYVEGSSLKISEGDDQDMIWQSPLLAYLAYGRFAKIRETFAFPLPKGFKL